MSIANILEYIIQFVDDMMLVYLHDDRVLE